MKLPDAQLMDKIQDLKNSKRAVILAHNYQHPEVQLAADFLGDSFDLSRKAASVEADIILFCGVSFMAETAKIISPEKTVLLPRPDFVAGCPMANMVTAADILQLREKYPDAAVVTYVNSTAAVKAEADICCTSSNAVEVVKKIPARQVIFVPDRNLASYVQRFVDKQIIPWDGYCYVHNRIDLQSVVEARRSRPEAELIVHPECLPEVIDQADAVLSTSGMIDRVHHSEKTEFMLGTEVGLIHRLQRELPDKNFYAAGTARFCDGMKQTRLKDLYHSLEEEKFKVDLSADLLESARDSLEKMLRYV